MVINKEDKAGYFSVILFMLLTVSFVGAIELILPVLKFIQTFFDVAPLRSLFAYVIGGLIGISLWKLSAYLFIYFDKLEKSELFLQGTPKLMVNREQDKAGF